MRKSKLIYLITVIILIAACSWAFITSSLITHNFKKEVFSKKQDNKKVDVNDLIVIETKNNQKSWELTAKNGNYNGNEKKAVLSEVIGNFYRDNKITVSFKAKEAIFNEQTKHIVLQKDAVVIYKDGSYVLADKFEWEGNNNNIIAKGNVKITRPNEAIVTGNIATMSNHLTNFKITGKTVTKLYGEQRDIK